MNEVRKREGERERGRRLDRNRHLLTRPRQRDESIGRAYSITPSVGALSAGVRARCHYNWAGARKFEQLSSFTNCFPIVHNKCVCACVCVRLRLD